MLLAPANRAAAEEAARGSVSRQAAASGLQTASAPAGPICVAILEPEVLGDLPAQQSKALAVAMETLLTETLAKDKGIVLVDRQALDKVLEEHKALAAGAADGVREPNAAARRKLAAQSRPAVNP